ncbi:MAG TPA: glycosyltransferase family 4 protein [Thermoanaerobaculia bacterium]
MKILILYETVYPNFIGGVEMRNHHLAGELARRGHEVTLGGFCGALESDLPNLRIASLGDLGRLYNAHGKRSTLQALRFAATVASPARLDLSPFDLIETANMPYVHLFPLAARCARAGKPLLVSWYEHWGPYWREYVGALRAPVYQTIEWLAAQLGDAVTATSELTRGRVVAARRVGRNAARAAVHLVPCGLDVAEVLSAGAKGSHGDGPPLIYAGRLLTHKRLELLLHAIALLVRGGGAALPAGPLLTIFGEGPDRPRLEGLTRELRLFGRVLFRGHVGENAEVWRELGRARIAVQPSVREGFGLFPLEAMAAGLPVVYSLSPESAVGELVRDGVEGIAVQPSDPARLAAVLARLLAEPEEERRLARQAVARAAAYDWSEIAAGVEAICQDLIARRSR